MWTGLQTSALEFQSVLELGLLALPVKRRVFFTFPLDYLFRLVMGNAVGGIEQADGREAKHSVGSGTGLSDPTPTLQKKQPAPPKLPVPPEEELEERFSVVLVSGRTGGEKHHAYQHAEMQTHHTGI